MKAGVVAKARSEPYLEAFYFLLISCRAVDEPACCARKALTKMRPHGMKNADAVRTAFEIIAARRPITSISPHDSRFI